MDNYIILSGAQLWVFLALLAIIIIGFFIMGYSYLKAERGKQYYQERCHRLCRKLSICQLEAMSQDVRTGQLPPSRTSRDTSFNDGSSERKMI